MSARIRNDDLDGAIDLGLADCIACGCCAYVCPSHIPLVQYLPRQGRSVGPGARQAAHRIDQEAGVSPAGAAGARSREKAEAAAKRKAERAAQQAAAAAAAAPASTESKGRNRMNLATLQGEAIASPHAHGGNTVGRTMVRVQLRWCRPPSTASGCSAGRRSSCGC
jgi:Na+-translocating ferredoxin:NAD+ oxidoreductase RnfC subunit